MDLSFDKMYSSLAMQSPFLGPAGVGAVDPHTFRRQGRSAASGDVRDPPPCSQRNIDMSKLKFAENTSRLMSPFSKDETGHESLGIWYQEEEEIHYVHTASKGL